MKLIRAPDTSMIKSDVLEYEWKLNRCRGTWKEDGGPETCMGELSSTHLRSRRISGVGERAKKVTRMDLAGGREWGHGLQGGSSRKAKREEQKRYIPGEGLRRAEGDVDIT